MKRNKSFNGNNVLYLVATPIGNLKEMSPRAIEEISSCDIVAAEDTRNSSQLLHHFNISKQFISLHEHNEREASQKLVEQILNGKKVVYMSDAGYPGISDPGYILVQECIANGISVSTICGSSAFLNALVASGLDTSHFYFYGFLSSKSTDAKKELKELSIRKETFILYEAPHRIEQTLKNMYEILGDRNIVLARELTKLNEEYIRGSLSEFQTIDFSSLKGEMVIIVEGNKKEESINDLDIEKNLKLMLEKGMTKKDSIELISKILNINKNDVYDIAQKIK